MFIYNLVVLLYGLVIRAASLKNNKAKQWIDGRYNWRQMYAEKTAALSSGNRIWIHCASYGEFEQGRPLIESIKKNNPDFKIILTFFSPSGYEVVKAWPGADVIGYLPLDTKSNAIDFLNIVKPGAAIFIKYEFWLNFLFQLQHKHIKTYLVSAVFKTHHPFFKWYGSIFRKSLGTFDKLFIQDLHSANLLENIGVKNYEVTGDTRFDRVVEIKERFEPLPVITQFAGTSKIIVGGSTWKQDEELLVDALNKIKTHDVKLILAPHELNGTSISHLKETLENNKISYSLYSENNLQSNNQVLIVDVFGLLSKLYFYCDLAYIGGGFGDGIHNCLEAAVYLKPVMFFGNTHHKYNEAVELINLKAARNFTVREEAPGIIDHFLNNAEKLKLEADLKKYFSDKTGTTQKVIEILKFN
ncbi:MAG: 3-deoxy-D-manno-octulosonic acid transferase [Bacteroidetes bacterium]|nr:3-deoxy-D-manno-octulosonic acid transferase [Bacteroidota bacterium]